MIVDPNYMQRNKDVEGDREVVALNGADLDKEDVNGDLCKEEGSCVI